MNQWITLFIATNLLLLGPISAEAKNSCRALLHLAASEPAFFHPSVKTTANGQVVLSISDKNTFTANLVNGFMAKLSQHVGYREFREPLTKLRDLLIDEPETPFFISMAKAMNFKINNHRHFAQIPTAGPLIAFANHPLNGADGISIAASISKVRKDVKVVLTDALRDVPGLAENAFLLQTQSSPSARNYNKKIIQDIKEYLKQGGAIVIFPSGEVSQKNVEGSPHVVLDREWRRGIYELYQAVPESSIAPVYVGGKSSDFFLQMKSININLAALFHLKDLMTHSKNDINLSFGSVYSPEALKHLELNEFLGLLRADVYSMAPQNP